MNKIKIISQINHFFDFNLLKLLAMAVFGLFFGVVCLYLPPELPFELMISYRLCIVLSLILISILMAFKGLEREMAVILPILIIVWNFVNLGWILLPTSVFLFVFYGYLSQIVNFKDFFVILMISTIILKIIAENII